MSQSDTPSHGLDPDEPHTPTWFTALGAILFLLGGVFVLVTGGDEPNPTGPAPAEGTTNEAEPQAEEDQAEVKGQ
jgi:hypothetical protein